MADIELTVYSTRFLGTAEKAQQLVQLLRRLDEARWMPERWNSAEPIRYPFTPDSLPEIIQEWTQVRTRPAGWYGGQLLFARKNPRFSVHTEALRGRYPRLNYLRARFDPRAFHGTDGPERLCRIADQFGRWAEAVYWWVSHGRARWRIALGTPGDRLEQIHWLNYFGTPYVELFGRQRLLTAPAHRIEERPDGTFVLWAAPRPDSSELIDSKTTIVRVEEHLGADVFAGRGYPERPCRVPAFDWSDLTLTDPAPSLAFGDGRVDERATPHVDQPELGNAMAAMATDAATFARQHAGVELDFSLESLLAVERLMETWHAALRVRRRTRHGRTELQQISALFGAYVGEVLRRVTAARWVYDDGVAPGDRVVALEQDGLRVFPVNKVYKRLTLGAAEGIDLYGHAVVEHFGRDPHES